jgi:hypothetical protein
MSEESQESDVSGSDWKSSLPELLREAPWIGKADSLETAVNHMKDAAQYLGNAIRIPSEDAGAEDREAFYAKIQSKVPDLMRTPRADDWDTTKEALRALGLPEKPDAYSVDGIDHAPDGEELAALRAIAHDAGLTNVQFRKFLEQQSKTSHEAKEEMNYAREQELKDLRQDWGFAYDTKVQNCIRAAEATGAPDYVVAMVKDGTMDAKGLKWLDNVYDQLSSEEPQAKFQGKTANEALTPSEAKARLAELNAQVFGKSITPERQAVLNEKRIEMIRYLSESG